MRREEKGKGVVPLPCVGFGVWRTHQGEKGKGFFFIDIGTSPTIFIVRSGVRLHLLISILTTQPLSEIKLQWNEILIGP